VGSSTTAADGTFKAALVLTTSGPLQVQWAGNPNLRPTVAPWTSRVAVSPKGSAPSDHPDTPNGARAASASPQGVWLTETLRSSSDVDWYAFGVARAGYHYVRLGHLPADYAFTLYDRGGNLLGVGSRPGRQFEEVVRYLPAGTYYVRVSVVHGYSTTVPYHLSFGRFADGLVILSRHLNTSDHELVVEMMNNTGAWVEPTLAMQCVTSSGRVVRDEDWFGASILAPRARGPLEALATPCPSGSSMRMWPLAATTSHRNPAGSWRLTPRSPVTSARWRNYPVTVTNTGTTVLRSMLLGVLEYDAEGRVQAFGGWDQAPLVPGASRYVSNIDISRSTPAPNRYVYITAFS
jgi:hypothetical protein